MVVFVETLFILRSNGQKKGYFYGRDRFIKPFGQKNGGIYGQMMHLESLAAVSAPTMPAA